METQEKGRIVSYHAHVYYRTAEERAKAETLRNRIAERFAVKLGRWRDTPVGPHAAPMTQIGFGPETFAELVPWLMLNRDHLVILLHPNTGMPRRDHETHALWLGEMLPIMNAEQLPEVSDKDETVVPDTKPA